MRIRTPILVGTAALAMAFTTGCSSKNPDALTAANVDENLAMSNGEGAMNAESADRNAAVAAQNSPSAAKPQNAGDAAVDNAVKGLESTDADDNFVQQQEDQFNQDNPRDDDN